jgi:nitroimidazol reductase NimA-like FMN-containing flavoprotein (pyridoxamine 5'-phosphate oxidase superfamily)
MPSTPASSAHHAPSDRTRLRRMQERGRYDAATIDAILDEGLICHIGFASGAGPVVIPMAYGRADDRLYLHGAARNAALSALASGVEACATVTVLDGLVLARSAFHHSMNYRSVVIFGIAAEVTDLEEKREALQVIVDHLVPGRSADARPPSVNELRATRVVRMPIAEASAKVRSGPPKEEPEDQSWPAWAGELPVRLAPGEPVPDSFVPPGLKPPGYVSSYVRAPSFLS